MTDHNSTSDPVQDERGPHSTRGKSSNHIKPTSEMVSAGVASVTQNMDGIMRGEINMAQLAERCWRAMEDARTVSVDDQVTYDMFRGRIALNELALIAYYVDPVNIHTDTPVSSLVYETCETVKRMAEDLGRMERKRDEHRLRADRLAEIKEEKIQLANKLSEELEEQRERAQEAEERERSIWESFRAEGDHADKAVAKVAELRRVIQEMVELGSDHIDTANESLVNELDGESNQR